MAWQRAGAPDRDATDRLGLSETRNRARPSAPAPSVIVHELRGPKHPLTAQMWRAASAGAAKCHAGGGGEISNRPCVHDTVATDREDFGPGPVHGLRPGVFTGSDAQQAGDLGVSLPGR